MAFFFYVSFYFIFLDFRKNLGNLERFMCEVCDKFIPCLSQWLVHVRLEHLTRGQIKQSRRLKCFCCSWEPPRSQYQGGKKLHHLNIFPFSKAVQQYRTLCNCFHGGIAGLAPHFFLLFFLLFSLNSFGI